MRTLLSQFCEEFEEAVRPLLQPLQHAADTLGAASPELAAREILPELRDLRHQIETLTEKVAGQQAYVLIFGPLKSGKSTLMNAVSASYVSEVTCLPAYPCMVYVSHAPERRFTVKRYNGREEVFTDPAAMRMQVGRAHTELANHIRTVEERGEEFDPLTHDPESIRKIDVSLPAGSLEKSSAVLVDTPGLYSRMKFGYDRMTREFRNTAACAIFVVKTDNLFLEQVFEEFTQLLELFSRIFLVVNLDTTKRDLRPDGSLAPSLEREDPIRIIEAFENLAMSAPLKAAAEEGRLRIYPVDLMGAASERLKHGERTGEGDEYGKGLQGEADFDHFIHDLESYLNSTEYLTSFLVDSLRQAGALTGELGQFWDRDSITQLDREVDDLEDSRRRTQSQAQVLKRLEGYDWRAAFAKLREERMDTARSRVASVQGRSSDTLKGLLEGWFNDDTSISSLLADKVEPLVGECQNDVAVALHQSLSESVSEGRAGLEVPSQLETDLTSAEIRLGVLGRHALIQVDATAAERPAPLALDVDSIPVKRTIWDWILFRSQAAVRKNLFGPSERPTQRIPRAVKQKRLGGPARDAILSRLSGKLERSFPKVQARLAQRIFGDYEERVLEGLSSEIRSRRAEVDARLTGIETRLREVTKVSNHLAELQAVLTSTNLRLDGLTSTYGNADPDSLTQPVEEEAAELMADGSETLVVTDAVDTRFEEPAIEVAEAEPTGELDRDSDESSDEAALEPPEQAESAEQAEALEDVELTPASPPPMPNGTHANGQVSEPEVEATAGEDKRD